MNRAEPTEVLIFGTLRNFPQADACGRLQVPHRLIRADSPVDQPELIGMLVHFNLGVRHPLPLFVVGDEVFCTLGEALMAACPEDERDNLRIVIEDEPAIYGGKKTVRVKV